jgi:hypothetical protein
VAGKGDSAPDVVQYRVELPEGLLATGPLARFNRADTWPMTRRSAKGRLQRIDLKQAVREITPGGNDEMLMGIRQADGPSVRPGDVLKAVFGLTPEQAARARVCKTGVVPVPRMER